MSGDADDIQKKALEMLSIGGYRARIHERAAAKERFLSLSKYELLTDLDDLRKDAIAGERVCHDGETVEIKVSAKAVLDITKFLLEHINEAEQAQRRKGGDRDAILAEQRSKGVGKAANKGAN